MHPDLTLARELQAADREIGRLVAEIAQLPKHIHEIEAKLAGAQRQLDADRAALAANQQLRKKLDNDIFPFQQKITKYKSQMFDVKTNEEYKALQHEISFAEGEIRKIEDAILECMVATEELEGRVKKAEKQLAAERAEVEKDKAATKERTRADEEELAVVRALREKIRKQMAPDSVREYDSAARQGKRSAIAEVREGACSECHVRLRPQALQEAKPNASLRRCENCGRIVIFIPPPPPETAAVAPAAAGAENSAT